MHSPMSLAEPTIEEQFRLVKRNGAFDYFDRLSLGGQVDTFRAGIDKYALPVHTTSWFYELGSDDALFAQHMRNSVAVGASTAILSTSGWPWGSCDGCR